MRLSNKHRGISYVGLISLPNLAIINFLMVERLRPSDMIDREMPKRLSDETLGNLLKEIGNDERKALDVLRKQANSSDIEVYFAGFMLSFSERHPDASLIQFFGSPKKRTPFSRYIMLRTLLTLTLPTRRTDLANALNEEGKLLTKPLRELDRNNIITYKSRGHDKEYSFYKLSTEAPEKAPDPYLSYPIVSQKVYSIILADPEKSWTIEQVADILRGQQPEQWQKESLMVRVSNVLSDLADEGYLKREGFNKHTQSEITLTENQREVVLDLVTTIDKFRTLDPEVLKNGKIKADEIIQDPKRVLALMAKAKEKSPYANKSSTQDTKDKIFSIVGQNGNSTVSQIQELLEAEYAKRLSRSRILIYLNDLANQGRIQYATTKGVKQWSKQWS